MGETIPQSEIERVAKELLAFEADLLMACAGLREPMPWGAAISFGLEALAGKRLARGEIDGTPTDLGRAVANYLSKQEGQGA